MTTPPGWYPDQTGVQRWFDGYRWTDAVNIPLPPKRGPELWIPITLLALGFAVIAWASTMGLPHPLSVFSGPHLTAPGSAEIRLDEGPWVVYEQNGAVSSNGPVTVSDFAAPTIEPSDITVEGGGPVQPDTINEHQTINGRSYTGVARFRVPAKGSYQISIASHDQSQRDVRISRPISYAFRGWRGLVVGIAGGVVCAVAVVLLIVSLTRRSSAAKD